MSDTENLEMEEVEEQAELETQPLEEEVYQDQEPAGEIEIEVTEVMEEEEPIGDAEYEVAEVMEEPVGDPEGEDTHTVILETVEVDADTGIEILSKVEVHTENTDPDSEAPEPDPEEPEAPEPEPITSPEPEPPTSPAPGTVESEYEIRLRLINEVGNHPNLWNYGHPNYRNWPIANTTWERISGAVAIPASECRQIWNSVKAKYHIQRTLSEKAKSKLRYFNALSFLEENFEGENIKLAPRPRTKPSAMLAADSIFADPDTFFHNFEFEQNVPQYFMHQPSDTVHDAETETTYGFHLPVGIFESGYRTILENKLKLYDPTKNQCIFCNQRTSYESELLFPNTRKTKANKNVIKSWKREKITSLCETMGLDIGTYMELFNDISFCGSCHQIVLDIEYWVKSIKSFQQKLESSKKDIENLLIAHPNPNEEIEEIVEMEDQDMEEETDAEAEPVPTPGAEEEIEPLLQVKVELEPSTTTKTEAGDESNAEVSAHGGSGGEAEPIDSDDSDAGLKKNLSTWKKARFDRPCTRSFARRHNETILGELLTSDDDYQDSFDDEIEDHGLFSTIIKRRRPRKYRPKNKKIKLEPKEKTPKEPKTPKDIKPKLSSLKAPNVKPRHFCKEPDCGFSSQTGFLLLVHINQVHLGDENPFHCVAENCGEKFPSIELLDEHKFKIHGSSSTIEGEAMAIAAAAENPSVETKITRKRIPKSSVPACPHCSKVFTTHSSLRQHVKVSHSAYQLKPKCQLCLKAFDTPEEVREHGDLHWELININPYKCVICNIAVFQSQLELQRHVQTEHETGLFKCHLCNIIFLTQMRLKVHKYTHHTITPRENCKCQVEGCGFQAKTPSALRYHNQKHGDLAYKCTFEGCQCAYKWKPALKRHIRTVHNPDRPFQCLQCEKTFALGSDLRKHEISHLELRPYMCDQCPAQYKQRKHLIRHHQKKHEEKTVEEDQHQVQVQDVVGVLAGGDDGELQIEVEEPEPIQGSRTVIIIPETAEVIENVGILV